MYMEQLAINNSKIISELPEQLETVELPYSVDEILPDTRFIGANTQSVSYQHLRDKCQIPVFARDNE